MIPRVFQPRVLVLFDGYCYLCSWVVRWIFSRDRRNAFVCLPLQSDEGRLVQNRYPQLENEDSVILVRDRQVFTRSAAAFEIARILGGAARLVLFFTILPTGWADWLYRRVAAIRYRLFGKRQTCVRPPPRLIRQLILTDEERQVFEIDCNPTRSNE